MKTVKLVAAVVVLLPLSVLSALAFVVLAHEVAQGTGWRNPLLGGFAAGAGAWLLWWFLGPRPTRVYVFGHELTHAIWAWCFGGTVTDFKFTPKGGYVRTNKVNFWIVLAPYFFPVYSLAAVWLWWLASWWVNLAGYEWVLATLVGLTWAFHVTFTLFVIPQVQSDITGEGWVFSLLLIFLMNLVPFSLCLALTVRDAGFDVWWRSYREAAWWLSDALAPVLRMALGGG